MSNIIAFTESDKARNSFYPTPDSLADKLLSGINWHYIESVLEPSAGKGNLAKYCAEKIYYSKNRYIPQDAHAHSKIINEADIDCIEYDAVLRNTLDGLGFRVVHDDFLTYETQKRYNLIAMNPPFDSGAAHLLKALDIMRRGGLIRCILNAETIRNPFSTQRKELAAKLSRYNAQIEFVQDAFSNAERETDVEVALVRIDIPAAKVDSTIVNGMREAPTYKMQEVSSDISDIVQYDAIEEWVSRYNFEAACGIRLIEEYDAMKTMLQNDVDDSNKFSTTVIELKMGVGGRDSNATINKFLRETRGKYWRAIFQQPIIVDKLTANLQQELYDNVERLKDYEFSAFNIMTLIVKMNGRIITGVEDTIIKLFDDWTASYWHEDSPNRHYYNGWRTNNCFKIGKKVIIHFYGAYDSWDKKFRAYNVLQRFRDIEKVFDFLDSGRTNWHGTLNEAFEVAQQKQITKNIDTKYFKVTIYKKGTAHLVFKDANLLEKFNMFACQRKGWLPPNYGRTHYKNMSDEEKSVVDSFQGAKKYEEVLARADYFLNTGVNQTLLLGGTM